MVDESSNRNSHSLCDNVKKVLKQITHLTINIVLWIFIIIFGSVPLFLGVSIRYSVDLLAKLTRPDLSAASSNDCAMARETPRRMPVTNAGLILRVDGKISCSDFKSFFKKQFLSNRDNVHHRNFFCDLESFCGYLYKRYHATNIDVDHHIKETIFDGADNKCAEEIISSWFQKPFHEDYPLWEILLLNATNSEEIGETILCIKISHALADGYSLVYILDSMTGNNSPIYAQAAQETSETTFTQKVLALLTLPKTAAKFLLRDLWSPDRFPRLKTLNKVEMMPLAWATVDLEPIKQLRRKLNVHFPCILYSLQIGAVRKLLLEKIAEEELTEFTYVSSSLPVVGHPRNGLINHWTGGKFKVPLKTSDAVKRVLLTNKSFQEVNADEAPYLIWKYVTPLFWLFPARIAYILSFINLGIFRYRSTISCIPQATEKYFLLGKPIKHIYHCPIMKDSFPQAVMLGCSSSQNQQIDLTLFGHPELTPCQKDMDRVMETYFKEELNNLLSATGITEEINWRK